MVALSVAVIAGLAGGLQSALSALAGGGIGVMGSMAYAWRAMRRDATSPKKAHQAQMLAEAYKFAVTVLLFGAVFLYYKEVVALPLFTTFALTFVVYWMALLKQR